MLIIKLKNWAEATWDEDTFELHSSVTSFEDLLNSNLPEDMHSPEAQWREGGVPQMALDEVLKLYPGAGEIEIIKHTPYKAPEEVPGQCD